MYLEHFDIQKFPFALTPNTEFFCHLPAHQEALNVLLFGVNTGEGFIKVIGEVGSGKTILCRKFLNALDNSYITAYIPNPDLSPFELRKAFAHELGLALPNEIDQFELLNLITDKLLDLKTMNKQVVLVIDEAQALSDESLEALRLLTNLETESEKLLQVVLFAQPELNERLNQHRFRQLNQRITFSYFLAPMHKDDLNAYLCHRLAVAGCKKGSIFDDKASTLLYRASGGVPRIINILCHKALLVSYGSGDKRVNHRAMQSAIEDSREITYQNNPLMRRTLITFSVLFGLALFGVLYYYYLAYLLGL